MASPPPLAHACAGSSGPGFDPNQYYLWKDGRMHNGLVVVAWQLVDCNPGDGGLAVSLLDRGFHSMHRSESL